MPVTGPPAAVGTAAGPQSAEIFKFVPKDLAASCRQLVETYHRINGYGCLPDILWDVEVRKFIDAHKQLRQIFRSASTSRSAKKANAGFVLIASLILSLEVLSSDYAGWGRRHAWAKTKADAFRRVHFSRIGLMDFYLSPQRYIDPDFASRLMPPEPPRTLDHRDAEGALEASETSQTKPPIPDGR